MSLLLVLSYCILKYSLFVAKYFLPMIGTEPQHNTTQANQIHIHKTTFFISSDVGRKEIIYGAALMKS